MGEGDFPRLRIAAAADNRGARRAVMWHTKRSHILVTTDIVESATRAFLEVINRIELSRKAA